MVRKESCGSRENYYIKVKTQFPRNSKYFKLCISLSLFSVQPYEDGRSAISAYWAGYTQAQLGAMMATYLTVIDSPSS